MNAALTVLWCLCGALQLLLGVLVATGKDVAARARTGHRRLIAAGFIVSGMGVVVGRLAGVPVALGLGVIGCLACPLLLGLVTRDLHPAHHVVRAAALGALVATTVAFA